MGGILFLPYDIIIAKTLGRRVCSKCGDLYNVANIDDKERRICIIGSLFGIITGISYIIVAFLPWDLYFLAHGAFGAIASFALFVTLIIPEF